MLYCNKKILNWITLDINIYISLIETVTFNKYLNSYYLDVISWTYLNAWRYIILIDYTYIKCNVIRHGAHRFWHIKKQVCGMCWLHVSGATTIMAAPEVRFSDSGAYIRRNFPSNFLSRSPCGRRDATAKWGTWEMFKYKVFNPRWRFTSPFNSYIIKYIIRQCQSESLRFVFLDKFGTALESYRAALRVIRNAIRFNLTHI